MPRKLLTIGFTGKTLREFADLLKSSGVTCLVDVRLRNTSQLSGFAKKQDLEYICELLGVRYQHLEELAPTGEIFEAYRRGKDWDQLESAYRALINERTQGNPARILGGHAEVVCLLCSEGSPRRCHRRVLAEMIKAQLADVDVEHLV